MFRIFFLLQLIIFPILVNAQSPYNVYFGNLHSHTDYSGGVSNPRRAFIYARDTAQLDFLAVTDHLESIYYSSYEWDSTKIMADEVTANGTFVGIAGYEWTSPTYNHCNVYNTADKVTPNNLNDWNAFVQSVVDKIPAFAQFNHPGLTGSNGWNSLANLGVLPDSAFALMEINSVLQEAFYTIALDSGWHVSPSNGQDNHAADWGTKDDGRTGIWVTELSRTSLFDAIKAGRTFATFDKNASVCLDIAGVSMGSRIPYSSAIQVHIVLNDPDGESWNYIQLVGANTQLFCNISNHGAALDTTITINPAVSKWIYLRAKQTDDQTIYSAPFYIIGLPAGVEENVVSENINLTVSPNPVNESAIVNFNTAKTKHVTLEIIDITGQLITTLCDQQLSSGNHQFRIPVNKLSPGVYILKYTDKNINKTFKFLLK